MKTTTHTDSFTARRKTNDSSKGNRAENAPRLTSGGGVAGKKPLRAGLRLLISVFAFCGITCVEAFEPLTVKPELKNLKAAQRADSYYVDIFYDLIAPDGSKAVVSVEASADNGAKYDLPITALTGDFGTVKPGLGKRIVWNAWNDWPSKQTPNARVRITADITVQPTPPLPAPRPNLVWIPPGTFTMGSPPDEKDRGLNEGPQMQVWISHGFWMAQYEVTQGEYQDLLGENPSKFTPTDWKNLPVESVTGAQAEDYCARLTAAEQNANRLPVGYVYRLPTEAEWEYACRAGTTTRFSFGDDLDYNLLSDFAWFRANSGAKTHSVGEKPANRWGLFDMHGNVSELCADWFDGPYPGGSVTDFRGAPSRLFGLFRRVRGGDYTSDGPGCRSAFRGFVGEQPGADISTRGQPWVGFRVVLAPPL